MKTVRYILLLVSMVISLTASAQLFNNMPTMGMTSTSSLSGGEYTVPMASVSGAYASEPVMIGGISRPKRGWGGEDGDGEGDNEGLNNPEHPNQVDNPLGATPWALMLLLLGGYAAFAAYRRRGAEGPTGEAR